MQVFLVMEGVVELCDVVSDTYSVIYMEQFRKRCGCKIRRSILCSIRPAHAAMEQIYSHSTSAF